MQESHKKPAVSMSVTAYGSVRSRLAGIAGVAAILMTTMDLRVGQAETDAKDDEVSKSGKAQNEKMLRSMRQQAEAFSVVQVIDGERQAAEPLFADPVFRYSDQPRGFVDATLWCWGSRGRPAALGKVEAALTGDGKPFWQFCLTSLADHPIDVDFGNRRRFVSKKAGIDLKPIPRAGKPSDSAAARMRHMKEMISRFAVTIHVDGRDDLKQEMRLLPRPVHRYDDKDAGLVDGVIFGLTSNGTNPDMLIVIELRTNRGQAIWQFGVVKMTDSEVHIRLDESEVWSSPVAAPLDAWFYFDQPRQD